MFVRALSLLAFVAVWQLASLGAGARLLPPPAEVLALLVEEAKTGSLLANLGVTLLRVLTAFALAMILGALIGLTMGRSARIDRAADSWLVILLNLPALVVIVLCYIWFGLTEAAAILAVALNKIPNTIVTIREGARAADRGLDDMAQVFQLSRWTTFRQVLLPQLAPYLAAASRLFCATYAPRRGM